MKRKIFLGIMILSVSFTFSNISQAATVKETVVDYVGKFKERYLKENSSEKGMNAEQIRNKKADLLISKLGYDSISNKFKLAVADQTKGAQRLEALTAIYAVKLAARELAKTNKTDGDAMSNSAEVFGKFIANSSLTGGRKSSELLNKEQLEVASAALEKSETLIETIIINFDKAERDSWTKVFTKHAEIIESGSKSTEEAFVQAVMEVKQLKTKEEAIEILKKIKDPKQKTECL